MTDEVNVTVLQIDGGDTFPALEFETLVSDAIETIPEEFRGSATCEMKTYYESESVYLTISYRRPPTAEEAEFAASVARRRQEEQRQRDLAMLAHLRAKYG